MKKQTRKESLISAKLNLSIAMQALNQLTMDAKREHKTLNSAEIIQARKVVQFWTDETERHERGIRVGI